jgi:hypothetical protein
MRTCLALCLRLEQAALAELQALLQCCRAERQGVRSAVEGPRGSACQQVRSIPSVSGHCVEHCRHPHSNHTHIAPDGAVGTGPIALVDGVPG